MTTTARNGGHLTATYSKNYSHYASLYNAEETKRCFMIEQHTVSALLSIIGRNGWEQYIDLVDGGHNELLFSKKHEETARRDSEASLKAGTRKEEDVQWFDREEVKRVRIRVPLGYSRVSFEGYYNDTHLRNMGRRS